MNTAAGGLDFRAILAGVAPVAWYVGMAVLAALGGYPGVVCITPMAWLIGLAAGHRVAAVTSSPVGGRPLVEAAIAGALVGLIEGVLAVIIGARMELNGPAEVQQALGLAACALVLGVGVTAALAVAMAWVVGRRRMKADPAEKRGAGG